MCATQAIILISTFFWCPLLVLCQLCATWGCVLCLFCIWKCVSFHLVFYLSLNYYTTNWLRGLSVANKARESDQLPFFCPSASCHKRFHLQHWNWLPNNLFHRWDYFNQPSSIRTQHLVVLHVFSFPSEYHSTCSWSLSFNFLIFTCFPSRWKSLSCLKRLFEPTIQYHVFLSSGGSFMRCSVGSDSLF